MLNGTFAHSLSLEAPLQDPEFQKMTEDYVEEHIPYSISPLAPPA